METLRLPRFSGPPAHTRSTPDAMTFKHRATLPLCAATSTAPLRAATAPPPRPAGPGASVPAQLALLLLALWLALVPGRARAFDFDEVAQRARTLASAPYKAPEDRLPRELRDIDYDAYRDIRFRPERSWWRADKLPFELQFFHTGRWFRESVRIHEVTGGQARPIPFEPALFDYGRNRIDPRVLREAGFAGFRVHYPINTPQYKDEVLVFLGASYLRAVGKGQVYGLSARALAVDTAGPGGEEFPRFTEFWIERPRADATELVIHALLDSPRITGAYRFVLRPGNDTVLDVRARLFPRERIDKLGLAPLTSMYLHGENHPRHLIDTPVDDYRPEVHDSDGLLMHTGEGEWIWRPLVNPRRLLVTAFTMTDPRGFGLMQRDRSFASYEDTEARYEKRPSAWIEPRGNWGPGRVELVQIPTPDETNDNIVAYWVPERPPAPQQPFDFGYRLRWQMAAETRPPEGWVVQSRRGRGFVNQPDGHLKFVVDFDGPALRKLPADAKLEAVVSVDGNAELVERNLFKNTVTGGWRMTVRVKRADPARPVEMRAFLRRPLDGPRADTLTETWSYIVPPRGENR